jgi:hypothetical protein
MMKSMAAFWRLAVADNKFWGGKPIELLIHSSYGGGADVTLQMMLFRMRRV